MRTIHVITVALMIINRQRIVKEEKKAAEDLQK